MEKFDYEDLRAVAANGKLFFTSDDFVELEKEFAYGCEKVGVYECPVWESRRYINIYAVGDVLFADGYLPFGMDAADIIRSRRLELLNSIYHRDSEWLENIRKEIIDEMKAGIAVGRRLIA